MSRQAVSLVITTLERDGFITREPGEDRRTFVIRLTERGQQVAKDSLSGQIAVAGDWFGGLTEEELTTLSNLLERVLSARSRREQNESSTEETSNS